MSRALPSIPTHAVDWRFFLPMQEAHSVLIVERGESDFQRSFRELGIAVEAATWKGLAHLSARGGFDIVAAPLGVGAPGSGLERGGLVESLRVLRGLMRPGGSLLIGFGSLRPRAASRLLTGVGFRSVDFFAAVPDLASPEYILPLDAQALGFVLRHRYQHRFPRALLRGLEPLAGVLQNFLPYYFAVSEGG